MTNTETNTKIYEDLKKCLRNLETTFTSIDANKINTVPFEKSWTAGQLMDHVLKSLEGVDKVTHGKTGPIERPPDQLITQLEKIFLDLTNKFESPEFVKPGNGPYEKEALLNRLKKIQQSMEQPISEKELNKLCLDGGLPGLGLVSCLEWLHFALYHTIRHTRQLLGIADKLKGV